MRRFIAWGVMVLFCSCVLVGCSSKAKEPDKVTAKKSASEQRKGEMFDAVKSTRGAMQKAGQVSGVAGSGKGPGVMGGMRNQATDAEAGE